MRRRIRVAGSLAVPALLGLSLLAPTTAQAADVTSGDYKAVFNYTKPGSSTLDHSILNDLAGLVDRAAPGRTAPVHLQLHRGRGRLHGGRRHRAQGGRRQAGPAPG
ncbi:hypothetical protein AB0N39_14400, partial [Streptomyces cellulosae]